MILSFTLQIKRGYEEIAHSSKSDPKPPLPPLPGLHKKGT